MICVIENTIATPTDEANIPIQKDNELALVLDQIDLGDHIPEALYVVIAEILTSAYRLSGKYKEFMDDIQMHSEASAEIPNLNDEF